MPNTHSANIISQQHKFLIIIPAFFAFKKRKKEILCFKKLDSLKHVPLCIMLSLAINFYDSSSYTCHAINFIWPKLSLMHFCACMQLYLYAYPVSQRLDESTRDERYLLFMKNKLKLSIFLLQFFDVSRDKNCWIGYFPFDKIIL